MSQQNDNKDPNDKDVKEEKVTPSSVDSKNEAAVHGTPAATDRVKPRSGDGLANEGTNVSYEEQR